MFLLKKCSKVSGLYKILDMAWKPRFDWKLHFPFNRRRPTLESFNPTKKAPEVLPSLIFLQPKKQTDRKTTFYIWTCIYKRLCKSNMMYNK